jgi:hypothetical protein
MPEHSALPGLYRAVSVSYTTMHVLLAQEYFMMNKVWKTSHV